MTDRPFDALWDGKAERYNSSPQVWISGFIGLSGDIAVHTDGVGSTSFYLGGV